MADKPEQHYQPEQTGMYELEFPAPQLSAADGRGPVLIHALEGFSDAGHAIRLAAQHLKNTLDTELVASFAIDELLDYRSRRPLMTFKTDHFTAYEDPELNLYALHDSVGTPFLLLAGMEPDLKWERFITAVRLLTERLGVRQVIGLGTIPMAVPHTRPVSLTAHANNKELIAEHTPWVGEVQVPASVSNLLEYRMAQHGHEVVGFTVHVPHYLAQTAYPPAAEALLAEVARTGSLQIPLAALGEAGAEVHDRINEQVEASAEVAQVVAALEQQYDAFVAAQENRSLLARDEDLPSGDELGAEFERFLAQQADENFKNGFHDGDDNNK
jgi:PAC2 family